MTRTKLNPDADLPSQNGRSDLPVTRPCKYWIDEDILILLEPCELPRICIFSGEQSQLNSYEFSLRVKPAWWSTALPIIGITMAFAGWKAFEIWSTVNDDSGVRRFSSRFDLAFLSALAILWSFLFSVMERLFTRKVLFRAYETKNGRFRIRKDLSRALTLTTFGFAIAVGLLWMFNGWFPWEVLPIAAYIISFLCYVMSTSKRTPSSRLSAIQAKDGAIKVYGLSPEFFASVRACEAAE